jgi:isopenicillin-N epimerase
MLGSMATLPLPERFQNIPKLGRIEIEQKRLYDEFRIEVPLIRRAGSPPRWFRISAQIYNSMEEYEYLASAMGTL